MPLFSISVLLQIIEIMGFNNCYRKASIIAYIIFMLISETINAKCFQSSS